MLVVVGAAVPRVVVIGGSRRTPLGCSHAVATAAPVEKSSGFLPWGGIHPLVKHLIGGFTFPAFLCTVFSYRMGHCTGEAIVPLQCLYLFHYLEWLVAQDALSLRLL